MVEHARGGMLETIESNFSIFVYHFRIFALSLLWSKEINAYIEHTLFCWKETALGTHCFVNATDLIHMIHPYLIQLRLGMQNVIEKTVASCLFHPLVASHVVLGLLG